MKQAKTVFVGLSGGVDSSVAAARLLRQGYNVVGVFIKVWHPDFMVCNWEAERLDAMRVAAQLEIPFLTCDAEAAYKQQVADYFIQAYLDGYTPNPDVLCNQHVKFGHFYEFARARGADYVATGHYAQNIENTLHRGADPDKDQSYFLWALESSTLAHVLFPIGMSTKSEIRREAAALGLGTASKQDSQGICFLGHVDIPEFLGHFTTLEPGTVLATDGTSIGTHQGALVYTLGQRHGFTLNTPDPARRPMYVVARDLGANTITVAPEPPTVAAASTVTLRECVMREPIVAGSVIEAQFRYRQEPFPVRIQTVTDTTLVIEPLSEVATPAAGQSCVLYEGTRCLGGGIISG